MKRALHDTSAAAQRTLRQALPTLPLAAAAAARVAFDARCAGFLSRYLGGIAVRIGRHAGTAPGLRVALSSLAGELVVELDPRACPEWALLDGLAREPQQQALACALAEELIGRVSRAGGFEDVGLEVRSLVASDAARPPGAAVAAVHIGSHPIGLVEIDASFGLFAAEEMRAHALAVPPGLRGLRLHGLARLATRVLPAGLIATVARGDVFLLGTPPLAVQWRIGAGAAWAARAQLDTEAGALRLETAPVRADEERTMETPDTTLPDIELPVQFEIQTASLALEEIAALGPGHVVALDVPVDRAVVHLVCQGRRVGSGQLVVVGDHLGVRVEHMAWGRHAAADR